MEYTLQKPGEKQRHLISVVGIASNGWVNRLYTVTGQYFEEDAAKYKSSVDKVCLLVSLQLRVHSILPTQCSLLRLHIQFRAIQM